MINLGEIVRADVGSGLQTQTLAICKMLRPDRLMVIDSTSFNHREQDFSMYEGFTGITTKGFPTNRDCLRFINGLTHIITAETIYNNALYSYAKLYKVKIFTQPNYEFLDHLNNPRMAQPYKWLMPSFWHLDEMKEKFPNTEYLPPPLISSDFKKARETNFKRLGKRRFLHVIGNRASSDRNGTEDIINCIKYCKTDFELVIRSQNDVDDLVNKNTDKRITFDIRNIKEQVDIYNNFDMMILPRRYGGLCLPANEALMSALPVVMTDISPNNMILPKRWLVPASVTSTLYTRLALDVYSSNLELLANKIDEFASIDDKELIDLKIEAFKLGYDNYSSDELKLKYMKTMELQ